MSNLKKASKLGQSIWLDYIDRDFLKSGKLKKWIDQGLRGVTSNPTIFEKAISTTPDYDETFQKGIENNSDSVNIYESILLEDIALAADILKPVYNETDGLDGYVSLEVNPGLAHDTKGTVEEVYRYNNILKKPNVMFKVPATPEGIPAVTELIGEGIPVNVTLIFSQNQYEDVALAYLAGLEILHKKGGNLKAPASVASFFVSRVDGKIDAMLQEKGDTSLQGKIAIANVKRAYLYFNNLVKSNRWKVLEENGARPQRLLWASTSVKNPSYPDTLYVDTLIGSNTVNTLPMNTLEGFAGHGKVQETILDGVENLQHQFDALEQFGISLDEVTDTLLKSGVAAFQKSYDDLLGCIDCKLKKLSC